MCCSLFKKRKFVSFRQFVASSPRWDFLKLELIIFIVCLEWFLQTVFLGHPTTLHKGHALLLTPAHPRLFQIQVSRHFHVQRKVENSLLAKHRGMWAPAEHSRARDGHRLTIPAGFRALLHRCTWDRDETFALDFPQLPIVKLSHFPRRAADTEKITKLCGKTASATSSPISWWYKTDNSALRSPSRYRECAAPLLTAAPLAPAESPVAHDCAHWQALLWMRPMGLPVPWWKMPWAGGKGKNSQWSFVFSYEGCLCTVEGCGTGECVPVISGKWEVLLQGGFPQPSASGAWASPSRVCPASYWCWALPYTKRKEKTADAKKVK